MLILKKPKTESSIRRVFIPATVAHQLKAWKREQERAKVLMDATFNRILGGAQPTAPAELPPQVGKIARGHVDTRHTDAAKAQEALKTGFVQHAKRGRPRKDSKA